MRKTIVKRTWVLVVVLLLGGLCYFAVNVYQNKDKLPEQVRFLHEVSLGITEGGGSKIEVFYLPLALETLTRITPERMFDRDPAVSVYGNTPEAKMIQRALQKTKVYAYSGDADVRVGCVVYDRAGKIWLKLSIDPLNNGYINENPYRFSGDMKRVLTEIVSPSQKATGLKEKIYEFLLKYR